MKCSTILLSYTFSVYLSLSLDNKRRNVLVAVNIRIFTRINFLNILFFKLQVKNFCHLNMSFISLATRASMRCFRAKVATYSSTFGYNGSNRFFVSTLAASEYPKMEDKHTPKNRPQGLFQLANFGLGWSCSHPVETLRFSRFKWHNMFLGTSVALVAAVALVKVIFSDADCQSEMTEYESYGNTTFHEGVNTRKNKDCYVLSFDGGGSKGVLK